MESVVKAKKAINIGSLKSSPGFLKCMRNVYLFFKEEKEKGALNIPINSFIERTAVACGVGRKTLYNYAKKGLFDDQPLILQQKKKKKRIRKKISNGVEEAKKTSHYDTIDPDEHKIDLKKKVVNKTFSKTVQIQTDPSEYVEVPIINSTIPSTSAGNSVIYVKTESRKSSECDAQSSWRSANTARSNIDYFHKTSIWQSVYSMNEAEGGPCTTELTPTRIGSCHTPSSSDLTTL